MDTATLPRDRLDLIAVCRLLVFLQGAILVASAIETLVFLSFVGPTGIGALILTGLAAGLTLLAAWGLGRRSRTARRWTLVAETGVLLLAVADIGLALFLAGGDVAPTTLVTRIVIPLAVIWILRRGDVRAAYRGRSSSQLRTPSWPRSCSTRASPAPPAAVSAARCTTSPPSICPSSRYSPCCPSSLARSCSWRPAGRWRRGFVTGTSPGHRCTGWRSGSSPRARSSTSASSDITRVCWPC